FKRCMDVTVSLPLPRLNYADAMLRYGSDKPDLRYGLEIQELTDLQAHSQHEPVREVLAKKGKVRGLVARGAAEKFSRKKMDELKLYDPTKPDFKIAWVIDFPSFIWDDEEKRWAANHHPFTAPMDEDLAKLESDPAAVRAKAYDLVINGYECAGGSIRIHSPEVQSRLFAVLGMTPEQAKQRFGF